jgi:tRNA(Ile)-lysidine synthase
MADSQAVAEVRRAVRTLLDEVSVAGHLAVAVSGGADSLALAAATAQLADRRGLILHGLIVDHRLQPGSADVAARAAKQLHGLGFPEVHVLDVDVRGPGGLEAAARKARYAALREALPAPDSLVLLGHTRDDQAETVLLGLGRGSGARSIAGMRRLDPPWARPLLDVPRAVTAAACADLGLDSWQDPHNADPGFARVRLRHEVLPLLEDVLQGGVASALARTAAQLREDAEALDAIAERVLAQDRRAAARGRRGPRRDRRTRARPRHARRRARGGGAGGRAARGAPPRAAPVAARRRRSRADRRPSAVRRRTDR